MHTKHPQPQNRRQKTSVGKFSLRTLLMLVLGACIVLGWLSTNGARERLAVVEVSRENGHVSYEYPTPKGQLSLYLQRLLRGTNLGEGVSWGVYQVSYYPTKQVTDSGLRHIREFPETKVLGLGETRITDTGLAHVASLRELRVLYLCQTNISDTGLRHINALTTLESLDLSDTTISDYGLEQLISLCNLRDLRIDHTNVTDAGLVHLYGLKGLQVVSLTGTSVTLAGVEQLRSALPGCQVDIQLLPNARL